MRICIYGASSNQIPEEYITAGEILSKKLALRGHSLVFGGGAMGLMGAAARGFTEGGGDIVGVAPSFFKVDGVLYDKCTDFIYTDTMRERKKILEDNSDCFIVCPGGVGTLDEFFEILTLKQLGRHSKPIVMYNVCGFFDELFMFIKRICNEKFMKESSLDIFRLISDDEKLIDYIENYTSDEINIGDNKYLR